MKRIALLLLVFLCLQASGQRRNGISVTYQPMDAGIGVRIDRLFSIEKIPNGIDTLRFTRMGVYAAYAHGNYCYPNITIKDHNRYEVGFSYTVWPAYDGEEIYTAFTAGLVFHTFGEMDYEPYSLNMRALDAMSITMGVSNRFNWIMFGVRYDPFKQESCIDLGILF